MELLEEKSDSRAAGRRNRFMTRLPRNWLRPEEYQSQHDMQSGLANWCG
jgi:hypothetical protein